MENRVSLTKKQRQAILERDNYQSQMRHYSEEKGFYKNENCPYDGRPCSSLNVHHIEPVHELRNRGESWEDVNSPYNLLTISECEHVGTCKDRRIKK